MWTGEGILQILEKKGIKAGTSAYIYNLDIIKRNVNNIKKYFEGWGILYSMKANPNVDILKEMLQLGIGIDAASKNEVLIAAELGYAKEKIFYSSPGKTYTDLAICIDKCTIIADSINELSRISEIGKKRNKKIRVGVRVNISNNNIVGNAFEIMGGIASKFGISTEEMKELMCSYNKFRYIDIIGLHVYFGSQILKEEVIINNLLSIAEFANLYCKANNLEFVNFGCGFGIPYKYNDNKLDISYIGNNNYVKHEFEKLCGLGINCNLELGRYLVGDAGVYVTSVEDIKISYGRKYIILADGVNGFFRPVFTKAFHKIEKCGGKNDDMEQVTIVGNLCTPLDQYYEDIVLKKINIGDWICFYDTGAYGYTMSLLDFSSHDRPLELIVSGE